MTNALVSVLVVEVASVPDREELVAEIWAESELLAELRRERNALILDVYPNPNGRSWSVPYEVLVGALQRARHRLEGDVTPASDPPEKGG